MAAAMYYADRFGDRAGIVYAAGVDHAERVAQALRAAGVKAKAVAAARPPRVLAETLAAYERGETNVLVNAQLLAEGWNAPRATICMQLAPTASRRVYQQRVGRIMRLHRRKEAGVVVDFADPAAPHSERTVTLHSLLDADVYRPGALVTPRPPRRRQRWRRQAKPIVREADWLLPVTDDPERRQAVIMHEWKWWPRTGSRPTSRSCGPRSPPAASRRTTCSGSRRRWPRSRSPPGSPSSRPAPPSASTARCGSRPSATWPRAGPTRTPSTASFGSSRPRRPGSPTGPRAPGCCCWRWPSREFSGSSSQRLRLDLAARPGRPRRPVPGGDGPDRRTAATSCAPSRARAARSTTSGPSCSWCRRSQAAARGRRRAAGGGRAAGRRGVADRRAGPHRARRGSRPPGGRAGPEHPRAGRGQAQGALEVEAQAPQGAGAPRRHGRRGGDGGRRDREATTAEEPAVAAVAQPAAESGGDAPPSKAKRRRRRRRKRREAEARAHADRGRRAGPRRGARRRPRPSPPTEQVRRRGARSRLPSKPRRRRVKIVEDAPEAAGRAGRTRRLPRPWPPGRRRPPAEARRRAGADRRIAARGGARPRYRRRPAARRPRRPRAPKPRAPAGAEIVDTPPEAPRAAVDGAPRPPRGPQPQSAATAAAPPPSRRTRRRRPTPRRPHQQQLPRRPRPGVRSARRAGAPAARALDGDGPASAGAPARTDCQDPRRAEAGGRLRPPETRDAAREDRPIARRPRARRCASSPTSAAGSASCAASAGTASCRADSPSLQTNLSFSRAGVIRGLHWHRRGQDDLFFCPVGTRARGAARPPRGLARPPASPGRSTSTRTTAWRSTCPARWRTASRR